MYQLASLAATVGRDKKLRYFNDALTSLTSFLFHSVLIKRPDRKLRVVSLLPTYILLHTFFCIHWLKWKTFLQNKREHLIYQYFPVYVSIYFAVKQPNQMVFIEIYICIFEPQVTNKHLTVNSACSAFRTYSFRNAFQEKTNICLL